jgi:hypothetical protein
MIPTVTNRTAVVGGSQSSASFGISLGDEAHLMGILREGLYSDKVLAILREYGANAWDAHRSVGKHDVPILVTLPTYDDATLRIRDYGPGLSHEDVFTIYTQYGRSTKRGSDDVVGQLGIGSKSGFCYSDSFTITCWTTESFDDDFVGPRCGTQRVYVATLGADDKGTISLLAELACDPTDTGVEIQIPTKHNDRHEFERTARRLFQHFVPRPTINCELPELPEERTVLKHGVIMPGGGDWIAVMGCVPYRVNLAQLDELLVNKCLINLNGTLTFDIGGVAMSASREELKYTAATKAALTAKFDALVDEYVTHALQELEAGAPDGWETRLRVKVLSNLGLPLPEQWLPFLESTAKVTYNPADFTIIHNKSACSRLAVTPRTRLLLDDTGNDLSGYQRLSNDDYVVRSTSKTPDELRTVLDAALTASGLAGVRIELLSTMYWTAPVVPVKKKSNPKHRARMFRLDGFDYGHGTKFSDNWEAVTRVPTKDDVFVTIENFRAHGYGDFFRHRAEDQLLAKSFGGTVPDIYGYKSTEKKPVDEALIEGTHYREWRKTFIETLRTPANLALVDLLWRAHPKVEPHSNLNMPTPKQLGWLATKLGSRHPIVLFCEGTRQAEAELEALTTSSQVLHTLAARLGITYEKSTTAHAMQALKECYPLLRRVSFRALWNEPWMRDSEGDEREDWVEYVLLHDERNRIKAEAALTALDAGVDEEEAQAIEAEIVLMRDLDDRETSSRNWIGCEAGT